MCRLFLFAVETISRRSARPGPDAPQRRRAGGGTGRGERRGRREDAAPGDARSGPMPRRPPHPCRPHPRPPPAARPGLERPQRGPERCPLGARETLSAARKAAVAPRRAWPGESAPAPSRATQAGVLAGEPSWWLAAVRTGLTVRGAG